LYAYDGLYQLKDLQRGELNTSGTPVIVTGTLTFHETWSLDSTGNWQGYAQDATGSGAPTLSQSRSANRVNEITEIADAVGPGWTVPKYDAAGNMTRLPQPNNPSAGYAATWDAWNRLVKLADGETTVAQYAYDPATRRTVATTPTEQRHFYYSSAWQILEERLGETPATASADRQFVWGLRYIDDCVLRDRTTTSTLAERLYALQDANWSVTVLIDRTGTVQERYAYSAYGVVLFLNAGFTPIASSAFDWEKLYCGYKYDVSTGLYSVRFRGLNSVVGCWLSADPLGFLIDINIRRYVYGNPLSLIDALGLACGEGGEGKEDGRDKGAEILEKTKDFVDKAKTAKGIIDAIKDTKFRGSLSAVAEGFWDIPSQTVDALVDALGKFSPHDPCGRWYRDTYLAILRAGQKCEEGCKDIYNPNPNSDYQDCFLDISTGNSIASQGIGKWFEEAAVALQKRCGKLVEECKKRKSSSSDCKPGPPVV
jgi:RHS repeat-associated protein